MVAETQSGQDSESNADYDAAVFNVLTASLRIVISKGFRVQQMWSPDAMGPQKTYLLPELHSLLADDPQQKATCAVSASVYSDIPNACRASHSVLATPRTEINTAPIIDDALMAIEDGAAVRSKELRLAKAAVLRAGLRWPPRRPATFGPNLSSSGAYWYAAQSAMHECVP